MGRLQDSPPLTRFIIERNKMTQTRVKAKLFEPDKGKKVSVFQTETWSRKRIEDCGVTVARERKKQLHGWAILATGTVPKKVGLTVECDDDPPGHANITGWPDEQDDLLEWQGELANHSSLMRLPQPQ